MTLKELRMWHWRQCLHARELERRYEVRAAEFVNATYSNRKNLQLAKARKREADFHLSAVQALNDPVWSAYGPGYFQTAEQDCYEADNPHLTAY